MTGTLYFVAISQAFRTIHSQRIFTRMKPLPSKFKLWLKRIGVIGFLFFLLKGIMWLVVIWFGIDLLVGC